MGYTIIMQHDWVWPSHQWFGPKTHDVGHLRPRKQGKAWAQVHAYIQALSLKPKMIICGASAYSRDWDYETLRSIADEINALLLADVSHPSGLIASKFLNNPVPHCHIITST